MNCRHWWGGIVQIFTKVLVKPTNWRAMGDSNARPLVPETQVIYLPYLTGLSQIPLISWIKKI